MSFWIYLVPMNYRYCPEWDAKLNQLLDTYKFTNINSYTANLGDYLIWIENHPYASFILTNEIRNIPQQLRVRASRKTILRAHKQLKRDYYDSLQCNSNS